MKQKKDGTAGARDLGVEVAATLYRRLKRYVADGDGRTIKAVVSAAIDEYLKKHGA